MTGIYWLVEVECGGDDANVSMLIESAAPIHLQIARAFFFANAIHMFVHIAEVQFSTISQWEYDQLKGSLKTLTRP